MNLVQTELLKLAALLHDHTGSIVLYGAGFYGELTLATIRRAGYTVKAFCDGNPNKVGTTYLGLPVIGISELAALPNAITLLAISPQYQDSAVAGLEAAGIFPKNINLCLPNLTIDWFDPAWCESSKLEVLPCETTSIADDLITILFTIQPSDPDPTDALNRLAEQTYPSWECLLLPVGDVEKVLPILNGYTQGDERFRLMEDGYSPEGLAEAGNYGIGQAVGSFIAFCDGGCLWDSLHLDRLRQAVGGADLGVTGFVLEDKAMAEYRRITERNSIADPSFAYIIPAPNIYSGRAAIQQALLNLLDTHTLSPIFNKLYRRSMLNTHSIRFNNAVDKENSQFLFNLGAVGHAQAVACVDSWELTLLPDPQPNRYKANRWEEDLQVHQALWAQVMALGTVSAKTRRLLGEILVGKLALLVQNDTTIECHLSAQELISRWEMILGQDVVGQAIVDAVAGNKLLQYLRIQLGGGLMLSKLLETGGYNMQFMSGYLHFLLYASNWRRLDENLFKTLQQVGAPQWALDTIRNPGGGI